LLVGLAMDAQAMTGLQLDEHGLILHVLGGAAWLAIGAAIGATHFLTLRWNVRLFAADRSLFTALAMQLARLAVTAGGLVIIVIYFGAWPLLLAAGGVLAARTAVLRFGVP
jgi:F1F0 ATPase subunit 2